MHSFSIISTILALSASALAYTTPTTFNSSSNPIFTPSLAERVPVAKSYKITWEPTEGGTVTLVLLRGPGENIKPLYAIAENIPNSGSFSWTPKSDLEDDTTHYGLQLIKDSNGQFQYSVQFGISNPGYVSSSSSSSASSSASKTAAPTGYEPTTTSTAVTSVTKHSSVTSLVTVTTPPPVYTTSSKVVPTYTYVPPTNGTTTRVPSGTSSPSFSNTALPTPTPTGNAASGLKVASGLLAGVAGIAAMLL